MNIKTPITNDIIKTLKAGDIITLSGVIYTGRDAAHKRMCEAIKAGDNLPFDFEGQVIYYAGPCPAKPGQIIGSCGPTTSGRMDAYSPMLIEQGLKVMIGKGKRNKAVIDAIKTNCGIYLAAIGGAGALISECVKSAEVIAYDDLGTEAVRKLEVENLPLTVIIDCYGNDLYDLGKNKYREI